MADDNDENTPAEAVQELGGQVAGGLDQGAEGVGEDDEDLSTGLETAGDVARGVSEGASMVQGAEDLASAAREGDAAGVAGAAGNWAGGIAGVAGAGLDGAADLVDSEATREALGTAAGVARGIGGAARVLDDVISAVEDVAQAVIGEHVEYELRLDGEDSWKVKALTLTETLNEPYEAVIGVENEDRDADARALLGAEVELLISRGDEHNRRVTGIVRRVVESERRSHEVSAQLHVVPALWALGQQKDSVIFQDKTAVEILETVLTRSLSPYRREVDVSGLGDGYAPREYCTQYRESTLAFCQRLMEEEGIGMCFDFDQEGPEVVVLFDRNSGVSEVATLDEAAIPYRAQVGIVSARNEPIVELAPARELTSTSLMVRDYDWTQDETRVEASVQSEDDQGRSRSLYEHGHARTVSLYDFQPGQRYQANDVDRRAERRHQAIVRDADRSRGTSLVVGMTPGRRFELTDHPVPGVDGEYLVARVVHTKGAPSGEAHHAEGESYHNVFECIPLDVEWRPKRQTAKPAIYGVQTAVVTGANNGDIHTDEYGRIQVLFHWDREGIEPTSCWLRVAQVWAGHDDGMGHPGFLFIPRVGMEVVVTFINGDPDRPLVTGSVYNGQNLLPGALPDEASRSIIRTRSLGGGAGYNELSFEDAAGNEEVYLRAERNLRELVLNNHRTHVHAHQSNRVGGKQKIHVEGEERHVHVEQDEKYDVDQNRDLTVTRKHTVTVHGEQWVEVDQNEDYKVHGHRTLLVDGGREETVTSGGSTLTVAGGITQTIQDGGWTMTTTGNVTHNITGGMITDLTGGISVTAGQAISVVAGSALDLTAASINLTSRSSITYSAPKGMKNMTPAREEHVAQGISETAVEAYRDVQQVLESVDSQIAMHKLAVTIGAFSLSEDFLKFDNTQISIENKTSQLSLYETIDLGRSPVKIIN